MNKTTTLRFRVTEKELAHYKDLAMLAGYSSVSDACREALALLEQKLMRSK